MLKCTMAVAWLALLVACGSVEPREDGDSGGAPYTVYFHLEGYNFDPTGGDMRVHLTYYANGVGASDVTVSALPWSSSDVTNIPSGGNVYISGSLTSSYNCNDATVTVSIMVNGQPEQSGTFACGSNFSLHETLP